MRGMNPRMMRQAMKRMGIQQQDIEATRVIIQCEDKEIVVENPQVAKVNMMGTDTFQISGEISERELDDTPELSEEDVQTVVDQAGCSEDEAREALEETKGDIAEAILKLSS